jgi:uncharacterized membrane protein YsdA (DUF1294 family)
MDQITLYILIILGLINLVSFVVMVLDKNFAAAGQWRVSEGMLFFLAIFFGGLGIYLGMLTFHHKTRKWYFYFGIPLILAQNFCTAVFIYQLLERTCLFVQP